MFVRAEKGQGLSVVYYRKGGSKLVRTGGTPAWRNNNPGNIRSLGNFAKENGSIGEANGFAIFPDYDTGRQALARLLRGKKYRDLSVFDAIAVYAPAQDKNDVSNYRKLVKQLTQLNLDRKIKSLDESEFQRVLNAIQRIEGWKPGSESSTSLAKITSVRKDKKGTIRFYQIEGYGWVSKSEGISLADSSFTCIACRQSDTHLWPFRCRTNGNFRPANFSRTSQL